MREMKKVLIALLAMVVLAGCSSNDDKTTEPPIKTITSTLTFEGAGNEVLAGPTYAGENLNATYEGVQYKEYIDQESHLRVGINPDADGVYNFYNGGIAVSRWNNMEDATYMNQCSVYYKNANGNAGNNGSKTFGAAYYSAYGVETPSVKFTESTMYGKFDHMYVCNAAYTALSMINGDDFAKKHTYEDKDWLLLTITGKDIHGVSTGKVEVYLSDFRTENAPGVLKEWKKIELGSLGDKVHSIHFEITGSDMGDFGINTPTYFCIDDIQVTRVEDNEL